MIGVVAGVLLLVVGGLAVVADPGRWSGYLLVVVGLLGVLGACSAVLGTGLTWPLSELEPGERVVRRFGANLSHRGVARGGTLVLTDRRLVFQPNSAEAALRFTTRSWSRSLVEEVAVAPRGPGLFSGALRRRLELRMSDGAVVRFVVGDVDGVQAWLSAALAHDQG